MKKNNSTNKKGLNIITAIAGVLLTLMVLPLLASASPVYKINENRQTYGTIEYASNIEECPDLIAAIGDDGTEGYVLASELSGVRPASPEEALALNNKIWDTREINLYASDGRNVIGKFTIWPPAKVIEELEDGTTIEYFPDATVITTSPDGTKTITIEER